MINQGIHKDSPHFFHLKHGMALENENDRIGKVCVYNALIPFSRQYYSLVNCIEIGSCGLHYSLFLLQSPRGGLAITLVASNERFS